ncbi:Crp/Fnr family transcriptional regulator [Pedobacter ginsenosidimutans]|uniref:Crp/Fnr family transcriptional regulator n=1 Tax=Pedobacter ginsenosidimutans TaxID=687842 RepID=A0A0T5VVH5_9SPHI|nr:Crp/Fnr family transcriptional regulator [Pedobacter ginsenosidimutans]KRT17866.1 Crp/Fnr family transcriptional regulator [Pedobacter ginsenosidimutans]
MIETIRDAYGSIFEKSLVDEISEVAKLIEFKEGDILIDLGNYIKSMPLLINGAIKIMREDLDTGELLLYFIEKGDTCAMTLTCCIGDQKSKIRAVAETDGLVAMIPIVKMEDWLGKYKSWRTFVFTSYNNRLNEMLAAIDNVAFRRMDKRLYNYLKEMGKITNSKIVSKTHQEIAYELHSSRVVISRLLKTLEIDGKVKLNRHNIELIS